MNDEKPMLIMSVVNEHSLPWLPLQASYLAKYTSNYKHVFYLNNVVSDFDGTIVGLKHSQDAPEIQHIVGVRVLQNYAIVNQQKYRSFLLLDSDCFPIVHWEKRMLAKMGQLKCESACAVDPENLEYHPCVCFSFRPIDCELKEEETILGERSMRSYCAPKGKTFPMLRTNVVNLHPTLAGIHYYSFYHHGAGSQRIDNKKHCKNYYLARQTLPNELRAAVFNNTDKFIELLANGVDLWRNDLSSVIAHFNPNPKRVNVAPAMPPINENNIEKPKLKLL